jgi:hypothetical protein
MRTVGVGWVAAAIEAAGHQWHAPRELALAPDRWGAQVKNERGGTSRRLPDLVFWPASDTGLPVAVVVEHGGAPKPRRERAAMEGWQRSIAAGQYAQVRYVARRTAAGRVGRLATQLGLTETQFIVGDRLVTDEPSPTAELVVSHPEAPAPPEPAAATVPSSPRPSTTYFAPPPSRPPEPAEQAAQRERRIRELLGQDEPAPRRRWRAGQPKPSSRNRPYGGAMCEFSADGCYATHKGQ